MADTRDTSGERSQAPSEDHSHDLEKRYAVRPTRLRAGNRLLLLRSGGEAFPAMLAAIASAEHSVNLETYILRDDRTGRQFADALGERARAGVSVRLIYDAVGGLSLPRAYVRGLRDSGVEVLEYHPLQPWKRRFSLNLRDHRKILVVDHRIAYTGGINISDEYVPESQGGAGWHDMHYEVEGPLVADLERCFRRVWVREGGRNFEVPQTAATTTTTFEPGCLARVIDNRKFRYRRKIRRAYLHAINRAGQRIHIMNAYFLPDRGIRRALRKAIKRGVDVKVIVPEKSDVAIALYAGQYMYDRLLNAGIQLLVWPDKMMHAKTAVIDSIWSAVGSYNLDSRSLRYNLEVLVEVVDREFGQHMEEEFQRDAEQCSLMTLEAWHKRPLWKKLRSWFFYQFRRWM